MNFYAVLGIPKDADEAAIRSAYKILARRCHPDTGVGSSTEKFRQVAEAYETLSDSRRRRSYDVSLQEAPRFANRRAEPMIIRPERLYEEHPNAFEYRQQRSICDLNELFEALTELLDQEFFRDLYQKED